MHLSERNYVDKKKYENLLLLENFFDGDGSETWKKLKSIYLELDTSKSDNIFLHSDKDPRSVLLRYLTYYKDHHLGPENQDGIDQENIAIGALSIMGLAIISYDVNLIFFPNDQGSRNEQDQILEIRSCIVQGLSLPGYYYSHKNKNISKKFNSILNAKKLNPQSRAKFFAHFFLFIITEKTSVNTAFEMIKLFEWSERAKTMRSDDYDSLWKLAELLDWDDIISFLNIYAKNLDPETVGPFTTKSNILILKEIMGYFQNYLRDDVRMFGLFSNNIIVDLKTNNCADITPEAQGILTKLAFSPMTSADFGYESKTTASDSNKVSTALSRTRSFLAENFEVPSNYILTESKIVSLSPNLIIYSIPSLPYQTAEQPNNKKKKSKKSP